MLFLSCFYLSAGYLPPTQYDVAVLSIWKNLNWNVDHDQKRAINARTIELMHTVALNFMLLFVSVVRVVCVFESGMRLVFS